jgi:hydroxymethylpyrimidine/phosphomethylpyrimidine kinase
VRQRPSVLTIAGSDSGGGAGIQADLKAIAAFGVHGASAITAITAQNSREVTDVMILPPQLIAAQIDAVMSDLRPAVIKIGMLGNAETVRLVAAKIDQWKPDTVVLDPVMIASSGARLLEEDAVEAIRDELLPRASVVTPNWPEAGELIRAFPRGLQDRERIAISFRRLGVRNLLLKGGHLEGPEVIDTLFEGEKTLEFRNPRLEAEGHGTGCSLASALAASLALGRPLAQAAGEAIELVRNALENRYATGDSKQLYLDIPKSETTADTDSSSN